LVIGYWLFGLKSLIILSVHQQVTDKRIFYESVFAILFFRNKNIKKHHIDNQHISTSNYFSSGTSIVAVIVMVLLLGLQLVVTVTVFCTKPDFPSLSNTTSIFDSSPGLTGPLG
jgi:hypothetical protein